MREHEPRTSSEALAAERARDVRWWSTMPETADTVRDALASGDTTWAMRQLCDAVNRVPLVAALGDRRAQPRGDARGTRQHG